MNALAHTPGKIFLMQIEFAAMPALFLLNVEQGATEKVLNSK
jgi:hypothetical protein